MLCLSTVNRYRVQAAGGESMAFFELRQYRMRPGQRDAWLKLMEEEIVPFQISKGMVIAGMFFGEEDKDLFVWLRRFESEEERERLYEAVYQHPTWVNDFSPRVGELIDREQIKVTRIEATPKSVLRQPGWGTSISPRTVGDVHARSFG